MTKKKSPLAFELFIALRYLFSKRRQTFIYVISIMSILGVALGVGALVVVLGVYNGFTTDIRDKILGANAHGIVMSYIPGTLENSPQIMQNILDTPGVTGATPFLYTEVMLSSPNGVKGLILRGIDTESAPRVLSILSNMQMGSVAGLKQDPNTKAGKIPGIIVGAELAKRLHLTLDSRVNLLSASGQKSTAGFTPTVKPFKVVGIFKTGMFEYDSSLGFVTLDAARAVLGLPAKRISGIEIAVEDLYNADKTAKTVEEKLGSPYYVRHWMEMNANLFAALELEKVGMFILLAMVVLIGSFSIVTTLVMLVMEKTRDIAILMSMGATRNMIKHIFMLQGTIIGIVGTALGYILGISLALLLKRYQFIKLPKGVYTIDHLPILLTWSDTILVGLCAMVLCFLATIYPARQAARLEPAEALRYE